MFTKRDYSCLRSYLVQQVRRRRNFFTLSASWPILSIKQLKKAHTRPNKHKTTKTTKTQIHTTKKHIKKPNFNSTNQHQANPTKNQKLKTHSHTTTTHALTPCFYLPNQPQSTTTNPNHTNPPPQKHKKHRHTTIKTTIHYFQKELPPPRKQTVKTIHTP